MGQNPSLLADLAAIWTTASQDIWIQMAVCLWPLQHCPLQAKCHRYLPQQLLHRNTSAIRFIMVWIWSFTALSHISKSGSQTKHFHKHRCKICLYCPSFTMDYKARLHYNINNISQNIPLENCFKKGYTHLHASYTFVAKLRKYRIQNRSYFKF